LFEPSFQQTLLKSLRFFLKATPRETLASISAFRKANFLSKDLKQASVRQKASEKLTDGAGFPTQTRGESTRVANTQQNCDTYDN
jgi:hypothetical protein